MRLARRTQPAAETENTDPVDGPDMPVTGQWTGGAALGTRAVSVLLWAALTAGPLALGWLLLAGDQSSEVVTSAQPPPVREQTLAAEFSERFVTAWLTGDRADAESVKAMTAAGDLVLPNEALKVTNIATASITAAPGGAAGAQVWSIITAADVAEKTGVQRRYFQVPVQVRGSTAIALTHPAVVPAPGIAQPDQLGLPEQWSTTGPAAASIEQFLTALLTGVGEVTRYVAPGTQITAVTPPPFKAVELRALQADTDELDIPQPAPDQTTVRVLARALGNLNNTTQISTQYALTIRSRDGRWEVAAIDPAPPVTTTTSSPPPEPVSREGEKQ